MNWPYEWQIGWRYTRAGRAGRRNGFISFISGVSMLGIALGVAALIIVLSVMNGFQKEVRDRMLSVISHVEMFDADGARAARLAGHRGQGARATRRWSGAAPFVAAQALVARGDDMRGALVRGIVPAEEAQRHRRWPRSCATARSAELQPGAWNIVLGAELARQLGVRVGDKVTAGGAERPGHAGRRGAAAEAVHRGRHLRGRPLRVRQRAGAGSTSTTPRAVPRSRAPPACSCKLADLHSARARSRSSWRRASARSVDGARLDAHQPQLVRRGADREAPDVHHPHADRRGGGVQPGVARW